MGYIQYGTEKDPTDIEDEIYDFIRSVFPNWEPSEANLETVLSEAFAQQISELTFLATDVPAAIFRYFGGLVGVDPIDATEALADTTWTMIDNAGYTIPAGTQIAIEGADGNVAFEVISDVVVPNGSTVTAAGEVQLRALNEGLSGSGLTAVPELIDILDFVASVALVGVTYNGIDAEDDDVYLNRLSERLELLADRPVLAADFVTYAKTVAGVHRAAAIDGLNVGADTLNNEKYIGICCIDSTGAACNGTIKTAVDTLLQSVREFNFVVNMADPTFTAITVVATVQCLPGYDTADVDTRVTAAVTDYLNPAKWGQDNLSNALTTDRSWRLETKVRFFEIIQVLNAVQGVDYVVSCTLNGAGTDVTMSGRFPLPAANPTVTITAT